MKHGIYNPPAGNILLGGKEATIWECFSGCWHIQLCCCSLVTNAPGTSCVTCLARGISRGPLHPSAASLALGSFTLSWHKLVFCDVRYAQLKFAVKCCFLWISPGQEPWTLCQTTLLNSSWTANSSCELHQPLLIFRSYLNSIYHKPLAKQLLSFDKYSISPRIYWEDSWGSPHPSHTHCGLWNFKNICTGCVWAGCVDTWLPLAWISSSFSSGLQMEAALWLSRFCTPLCPGITAKEV